MSEYDKKIEEVKALCKWFNEHRQELVDNDGSIIISAVYGNPAHITNIACGNAFYLAEMLARLGEGCQKQFRERNAQ